MHYSFQLLLVERAFNAAGGYINTKYQAVDLKYIEEKKVVKPQIPPLKKKKRRKQASYMQDADLWKLINLFLFSNFKFSNP